MTRKRKLYSDEFKLNVVMEYKDGLSAPLLSKKYDLGESTVYKWINEYSKTRSFKTSDNMSDKDKELKKLRKKVKKLEMEVDILKQIALLQKKK